jgi:hypothetical protein
MNATAARYAAATPTDAPTELWEILEDIWHLFEPNEAIRFDVKRTRYTQDRQPISRGLRILVYKRDNFSCRWCGTQAGLELDHIIPWSAGGADTLDNLRTLCHGCNTYRSNFECPADRLSRQLPSGYQCVNCAPDIIGDPDLRPIFCVTCEEKSCGWRSSAAAPVGWEESEVA